MALMLAALGVAGEDIAVGHVWVATGADGQIAGVVALAPGDTPGTLELNKLFIEPRHIRGGVGHALLAHAVAEAQQRGAKRLTILADPKGNMHTLPNPQQRFDGCRQFCHGSHFEQLEHAGCETVTVYRPDLEAVDLEQPANRALDLQLRGDKLHPGGEGRAHRLRRRRLDMHRAIVPEAHHLRDAAGIVLVGLDRARG